MSSKAAKVLAIDGPSGSGKSTIARRMATRLNFLYVDTGAMFRALGHYFHRKNISFDDELAIERELSEIELTYGLSSERLVEINKENLTQEIRKHYVSDLASKISKLPSVRNYLLNFQRKLASNKFCVMEGRDIGTVVFPDAFCKVFLTADLKERALRRLKELESKGEKKLNLSEMEKDLKLRDDRDASRKVAPLACAEDATELDTTTLTIEQVEDEICRLTKDRAKELNFDLNHVH